MSSSGEVAEWFKAPVLKTGVPARVPWVRIPPSPPFSNPDFGIIFLPKMARLVPLPALIWIINVAAIYGCRLRRFP